MSHRTSNKTAKMTVLAQVSAKFERLKSVDWPKRLIVFAAYFYFWFVEVS